MAPWDRMVWALPLAAAGMLHGEAAEERRGFAGWLAHVCSPEMRRAEARLDWLAGELKNLPELSSAPFASRYGFRSEKLDTQDGPQWVQIDLGRSWPIDRIAAVPTHIPALGNEGEGYGFPLRFSIEVSGDPGMKDAFTVVDRTGGDVVNPGRYPMVFGIDPTEARYIRFTATKHSPLDEGFFWALEELVVLSGNTSVATTRKTMASSSLELFPNWSMYRINDGQSELGMPVTMEKSPTKGYASAVTNYLNQEEKWIEVDLGEEHAIDEVRLFPVVSGNFETPGLHSFPRRWKIELANDPGFKDPVLINQALKSNTPGYPGRCPFSVPAFGQRGRYLRLVAQELWGVDDRASFALAEIRVYAGGENIALGKPVRAKDQADTLESGEWSPGAVVDGFNSTNRLSEYPEYLDLIERRGRFEGERERLVALRDRKINTAGMAIAYGGGGLGAAAFLGFGWLLVRQRTMRSRAVAHLRNQIARDLHDDIGSNLGGIVLLSEIGGRYCENEQAREDFKTIREAAETTSQSMQDIVWLIERENVGLRELVTRLRRSAEALLGESRIALKVSPADFPDRPLSLFFRRHVFFAFKETINNARKHSGATAVELRIWIDSDELRFEVHDNGCGFDPESASQSGHGLANLRRRAERVKGDCTIKSSPGEGSVVVFSAPFKASKSNI